MLSFCLFRPDAENKILIILPDEDITSSLHPFHFLVMLASLASLPLPSDATPAAPPTPGHSPYYQVYYNGQSLSPNTGNTCPGDNILFPVVYVLVGGTQSFCGENTS